MLLPPPIQGTLNLLYFLLAVSLSVIRSNLYFTDDIRATFAVNRAKDRLEFPVRKSVR